MENKLDWSNFESKFGSFAPKIKPFFDEGKMDIIYSYLKEQSKQGKKIAPLSENTFKFLEKMDINNIHCVIVGFCPYHSIKNNKIVASGVPLDCSITQDLQPSLATLYDSLALELGVTPEEYERTPDVSYMLDSGIFLINAANTTEIKKAGNHLDIWHDFTKHIFETVIAPSNVPVVFLGAEAFKFKKYLLPLQWSFKLTHPASVAYSGQSHWETNGVFKKVSQIVRDMNGKELQWLKPKEKEMIINDKLPWDMKEDICPF